MCLRYPLAHLIKKFRLHNIVFDQRDTCSDVSELKSQWKAAIKILRSVRDKAYDHRAVHLRANFLHCQSLTFKPDESGADENRDKIRRITELINTENMRRPFRGINSMTTPLRGGLSKLFVPSGVKDTK